MVPELSLGLPGAPPGSFKPFFHCGLGEEDGDKLQSCVLALEDERKKIEVFRRELPLCMQLMSDAIEALKSHLAGAKSPPPPALEEFIASKPDESPRTVAIDLEKPSWMAQAQLWSPSTENPSSTLRPQAQRLVLNSNSGAFSPFVRRNNTSPEDSPSVSRSSDTPSLEPQQQQIQQHQMQVESDKSIGSNKESNCGNSSINNLRKARRCWSADLHKKFLNALEQLGGSQATPKLIREIMKVDGLTNDEVKSHLQKYRLHTRRPLQRSEASAPVVIWVPAEYAQHQKCQVPGLSTFFAQQQQQQQQQQCSEVVEPEKSSNPAPNPNSSSEEKKVQQHEEIDDDGDVTETEDSSGGKVVDEAEAEPEGEAMKS